MRRARIADAPASAVNAKVLSAPSIGLRSRNRTSPCVMKSSHIAPCSRRYAVRSSDGGALRTFQLPHSVSRLLTGQTTPNAHAGGANGGRVLFAYSRRASSVGPSAMAATFAANAPATSGRRP